MKLKRLFGSKRNLIGNDDEDTEGTPIDDLDKKRISSLVPRIPKEPSSSPDHSTTTDGETFATEAETASSSVVGPSLSLPLRNQQATKEKKEDKQATNNVCPIPERLHSDQEEMVPTRSLSCTRSSSSQDRSSSSTATSSALDELNLSQEQKLVIEAFSKQDSSQSITLLTALEEQQHQQPRALPPQRRRPVICIQEPDDNADTMSASSPRVQFSTITIREYPIEVGDNPATVRGIPLTIGWEYERSYTLDVEDFEWVRPVRRSKTELKTESLDRLRMLKAMGYSREELQQHTREVNRARERRQRTRQRLHVAPLEEVVERTMRALQNATIRRRRKQTERNFLATYKTSEATNYCLPN